MLTNDQRATYGHAAIKAGAPDCGSNGDDFDGLFTDAGDAITNILHALYRHPDADKLSAVFVRAWMHFEAEAINPDDIEQAFQDDRTDYDDRDHCDLERET